MGMAAFNRMRREQAEKAEKAKLEGGADNKGASQDNQSNIDEMIADLKNLKADGLKLLAAHFEIEYTNVKETRSAIEAKLEGGADE